MRYNAMSQAAYISHALIILHDNTHLIHSTKTLGNPAYQ